MKHFYFIQFPEQLFNLRQSISDGIPVVPFFEDLGVFNRIISSVKRWNWQAAVFYEKSSYPFEKFKEIAGLFDLLFITDPGIARPLRASGFKGGIYLFSNFRMLVQPDFFKELGIVPVVNGKSNYELAKDGGLEPVYFVTDKSCVAEFGLCLSRKSTPQYCFGCDNRCREKSTAKAGLDFPISIKPELTAPEGASFLLFSEKTLFPKVKTGEPREKILEKSWNYRYPIGVEILKPGKTNNKRDYVFAIDKNSAHLFDKGLIEFYGYSGSLYKGKWIGEVAARRHDETKITAEIPGTYQSVLMICRYTEEEKDFLKKARHFLYTLPEQELVPAPEEEIEETPQKRFRKYSERVKLTLIADDEKKFAAFKGKNVARRVLVYDRNIPHGFADYIYIAGTLVPKDIADIAKAEKLKGIVAADMVMKETLEKLFPQKEILLHPLAYTDSDEAPSYLSASTSIFISKFKSENRSSYSWTDINIFLKNRTGYSEFISHRKMIRNGKKRELWVNIADITDDALKFLKSQSDQMLIEMR